MCSVCPSPFWKWINHVRDGPKSACRGRTQVWQQHSHRVQKDIANSRKCEKLLFKVSYVYMSRSGYIITLCSLSSLRVPAIIWNEWIAVSSSLVDVSAQLGWGKPPTHLINNVTARNQLDPRAGVILCFISATVTAKFLDWFFCLSRLFFCFLPSLFNLSYPLLCPSTIFFHLILPISSCYYSFVPVLFDISKHIGYLFIWQSQRPQEWRYASVTHGPIFIPTDT